MSPGYDRADHSGFRRRVPDSCLFCHNGYRSEANGGLARAIDCQRCHGPGEAHAARRGPIVNPARLAPARRLEVCLRRHLEAASRAIPESIRRYERTPYSYRPGEPLSNFTIYFDRAAPDAEDSFTVNHSADGLFQSRSFQKAAEGTLICARSEAAGGGCAHISSGAGARTRQSGSTGGPGRDPDGSRRHGSGDRVAGTGAAEAALRRSLALDSESPGVWLNFGVALEAQGRKSAAADS
jgi:hypothetical protein